MRMCSELWCRWQRIGVKPSHDCSAASMRRTVEPGDARCVRNRVRNRRLWRDTLVRRGHNPTDVLRSKEVVNRHCAREGTEESFNLGLVIAEGHEQLHLFGRWWRERRQLA